MSDPVTNVEIEDVLSSIRRLVSNGPQGRAAKPAAPPAEAPPEERLVLTPALRVDDSPPTAQHDSFVWKDMLDEAKTGEPYHGTDPEPETDSLPEPDSTDLTADEVPQTGALFQSRRTPLSRSNRQTEDEAEAPRPDDAAPLGLEAQAAEFEAAVASRDDQWEPDGTTDDALAGRPVPTLDWRDLEEETQAAVPENTHEVEPNWGMPDWTSTEARAAAEQEPERQDTSAQEQDSAPDATGSAASDTPDAPRGLSIDDSLLDEDTLRDLIAEIVREELQGALGERITRNVRKLVRREIHRALTSQDFD